MIGPDTLNLHQRFFLSEVFQLITDTFVQFLGHWLFSTQINFQVVHPPLKLQSGLVKGLYHCRKTCRKLTARQFTLLSLITVRTYGSCGSILNPKICFSVLCPIFGQSTGEGRLCGNCRHPCEANGVSMANWCKQIISPIYCSPRWAVGIFRTMLCYLMWLFDRIKIVQLIENFSLPWRILDFSKVSSS